MTGIPVEFQSMMERCLGKSGVPTFLLQYVRRASVPQLADSLIKIETVESPIPASMDLQDFNPLWELSPLLASRLTGLTRDVSFCMAESTEGNGIEAWRLLSKKYNPTTHARCVHLVSDIISFRISKSDDVLTSLVKREAKIASLQSDHKEVLSGKLKTGFLLTVLPQKLAGKVIEQLYRL